MNGENSQRQSNTLTQPCEALYNNGAQGQPPLESSQMSSGEVPKGVVISSRSPGTLNFSTRKQQIERINQENMQMLRTLQQTKPTISLDQWKQHARRQDGYRKNISHAGQTANQMRQYQRQTFEQRIPELDQLAMHVIQENRVPQHIRQGVKSGSLPKRSGFYVHTRHQGSKKAKSSHTYGGALKGERFSIKNNSPPNQGRTPQQLQQILVQRMQPQTSAFGDSTEVTQKIESVINMFPQPTEEQLHQFKELHENSQVDLMTNPGSNETFQNDMNTITNIQVTPADNKSDNQAQNYNLEILHGQQNQQVVSQPVVDQSNNRVEEAAPGGVMQSDNRRVRTTMPGKRNRTHGAAMNDRTSPTVGALEALPEREPSFDMQYIQKPTSMANSLNSGSHVPQIIVRQGGRIRGWTGCNPMLIPIDREQRQQEQQQQQQNDFYPRQMHSLENGCTMQQDSYGPCEDQGEELMMIPQDSRDEYASMNVPKASFYDYQYNEGPQYAVSFDPRSGQPMFSDMDALTMNAKLNEMQGEIQKRMHDENTIARHQYRVQKAHSQKQKNIKQIMKAYAYKNAQIGPYGTNNAVINQLQSRKVPVNGRKMTIASKPVQYFKAVKTQAQSVSSSQPGNSIKRNLRAQTHSQSPPKRTNAYAVQAPASHRHPQTNQGATARKPRDVIKQEQQPSIENNDDQVGGGPAAVSPEVHRLQANRPQERQQRNRGRREPENLPSEPEIKNLQTEPVSAPSGVSNKESATQSKEKEVVQQATQPQAKPKPKPMRVFATKAPIPRLSKPNVPSLPFQKAISPSQKATKKSPPKRASVQNSTHLNAGKGDGKLRANTQPNKSDGSTSSNDQRASSTIEEGIMGLKYLPVGQSPPKDNDASKKPTSRNEPTPLAHPEEAAVEEPQTMRRFDSKKTSQLTVDAIASRMEEEVADESHNCSRQGQTRNQGTHSSGAKAPSESNAKSPLTRVAPHQETQVGLMQVGHIEDQPIMVDLSDQQSNVTEPTKAEASSQRAAQRRLSSGGENLIEPERNEEMRQSIGTDGCQNPYSDFEEDGEQAAVGSGIVETTGDYEEDDYEELEGDNERFGDANSNSDETPKMPSSARAHEKAATEPTSAAQQPQVGSPVGTIAQLVQKQQQLQDDNESNYSDDMEPEQANPVAQIAADDDEMDYQNEQFMESGSHEMSQTAQFAPKAKLSKSESAEYNDDDDDDDQDYDQDEFSHQQSKDERNMSLESDQDAPENEFEQIKDDDYAEEDDERY